VKKVLAGYIHFEHQKWYAKSSLPQISKKGVPVISQRCSENYVNSELLETSQV
jgi:hypothetical protein